MTEFFKEESERSPPNQIMSSTRRIAEIFGGLERDRGLSMTLLDELRAHVYFVICASSPDAVASQIKIANTINDAEIRREVIGILPYLSGTVDNAVDLWRDLLSDPLTRGDALDSLEHIEDFVSQEKLSSVEFQSLFGDYQG
ncbi:hypothetical protein GOPIP_081_00480 [Gordonia polyisoprenivorans NBRC 16320 = JCM 10675]|uniref:Uncharacterized protein n=1 Tax=Gordonia polyisoprenivorans TaxID=84595 RepID=A0A846WHQ7_9ACTN|nr:hypothetical protein [Gordonia polyisoprenivorans]NKY00599.1 hypothetical protein [Gordonia polyisoprenivorans]GAB25409.1 hypothetical protein GOPIP_081_00480 [Gordonia polyisoprenivorans NBRC 16320 = JCM 10675]